MLTKEDKKWIIELLFRFAYQILSGVDAKRFVEAERRRLDESEALSSELKERG